MFLFMVNKKLTREARAGCVAVNIDVQSMPAVRIRFVVLLAFVWMNILHAVTAARQEPSPQLKRLQASCKDAGDCPVTYPKEDLKKKLTPLQYRVTQEKGTERAFSGKYVKNQDEGVYTCVVCGNQLFSSDNKYDSQSGWPSFYDTVSQKHIRLTEDNSHGTQRIEAKCRDCNAHLGHVFDDGPKPTGLRYCVNSASLDFKKQTTV